MCYVAQGWAEMEIKHAQQSSEKINRDWKHKYEDMYERDKIDQSNEINQILILNLNQILIKPYLWAESRYNKEKVESVI